MPGPFAVKRIKELDMCFSDSVQHDTPAAKSGSILFSKVADAKNGSILACKVADDWNSPILPDCLMMYRNTASLSFPALIFLPWVLYPSGKESHWEVLDCFGHKHHELLPMPGPLKAGFGVVVLNGKLLVIAGYSVIDGTGSVSSDVYQYDSCLNRFMSERGLMSSSKIYYFLLWACAIRVNGKVYVVGGCGIDGGSLSCAEMYDPETDKWTLIESLRRPRWGCFACGFEGKLYVMGGRSSFTIGNSRFVDVYSPEDHAWCQMKNGCVMVTAHAVLGKNLCCMEWKNERKLAIFNPAENSWKMVPVPVTGSSSIGFRFGILDGKLLLFPVQEDPGYHTLSYNPDAAPGAEWQTSEIKPSGLCLCSVTIKA
ncbi:F-box/kelch-repeat protein [Sesamum angolense]|uniref:F-box/kelch-repeat protein n=1 Tax=Sesamum angolense TaxID=2727404 RepID=A0AAE1X0X3_9LAMI|nr:F-box/kelch-repeat protein [Sesamum angolense]